MICHSHFLIMLTRSGFVRFLKNGNVFMVRRRRTFGVMTYGMMWEVYGVLGDCWIEIDEDDWMYDYAVDMFVNRQSS